MEEPKIRILPYVGLLLLMSLVFIFGVIEFTRRTIQFLFSENIATGWGVLVWSMTALAFCYLAGGIVLLARMIGRRGHAAASRRQRIEAEIDARGITLNFPESPNWD